MRRNRPIINNLDKSTGILTAWSRKLSCRDQAVFKNSLVFRNEDPFLFCYI